MARGLAAGMTVKRLRAVLLLLFALLAIPALALIAQTQRQLRWESYHQYGALAGELALRIDAELQRLIAIEEARGYADYAFVTVSGEAQAFNSLQRSALSQPNAAAALPGAIGWFQIDADGAFRTPLLPDAPEDPAAWGLTEAELVERRALADRLRAILAGEAIAGKKKDQDTAQPALEFADADAEKKRAAGAEGSLLDKLASVSESVAEPSQKTLGRVDDLKLDMKYQVANVDRENELANRLAEQRLKNNLSERSIRKEQAAEPVQSNVGEFGLAAAQVRWFESELDPFQFRRLDAQHALLYRRVWREGRRGLQGVVLDTPTFLQRVVLDAYESSALADATDLIVAAGGDVLSVASARSSETYQPGATDFEGEVLHQVRLSAPFDDLELLWSSRDLPAGPGARLIGGTALILFATLVLGLFALYRLGLRQLALAAQQRDFVSAVSHELKTPLTSIRMYAEMLRAGWANEDKKREYYEFIHDESERLSRLIGNVLQLARLEREELDLQPRAVAVAALLDMVRSKLQAQVERAGFEIDYAIDPDCALCEVQVDADAFVQILINLADNALKFAARGERRRIEISARTDGRDRIAFVVRDFGPGVPAAQVQRIFEPFQRGGSELTREAPGTGIGLALARQLARAMHGDIGYRAADPGAQFTVWLPAAACAAAPETL
jgi:two-component system phosphate regulon sensor histidine kinase PhoR